MVGTYRVKLRRQGRLTLPGPVARALHVAENDEIEFTVTEFGEVSVRGFTRIPADQKWFWTPAWQAGEREASEQIAAGNGRYFDNEDQLFAYLDELASEPAAEQGS